MVPYAFSRKQSSKEQGVIPVIVSLLTLAARLMGIGSAVLGMVGFLILAMLPVSIITSRILWEKGKIQVVEVSAPDEKPKT